MKLKYRKLGEFIRLRDQRNTNLITEELLGINIDKEYMPSVANVIGTDLTKYKIIEKNVFACNPMHVGRDEKLPVALYKEDKLAIVSPAYFVFEIIDRSILNEEYLMMWFRRSEFDRNCWFKTDGSVRGGISWNEICELELPVPEINKQKSIVKAYKSISNRINLKQQINDNLVKQALTKIQLFNEEDIRKGNNWESKTVQELVDNKILEYPVDGNHGEIHPKTSDYVASGIPFIMANDISDGYINYNQCSFISKQQAKKLRKGFARPGDILLTHKATIGRVAAVSYEYDTIILTPQVTYYRSSDSIFSCYLKYYFMSSYFQSILDSWSGAGSTRAYIGITKQCELPILIPPDETIKCIAKLVTVTEKVRYQNYCEERKLKQIQTLLIEKISSY